MATRKWIFSVKEKQHEVLLKRGLIPNPEIWLDGQLIEKWHEIMDKGSLHRFVVEGDPVELGIVQATWGLEYYLLVDGQLVYADGDKHKVLGKTTKKTLGTRQNWLDLGKTYELEYYPSLNVKQPVYQHRLIGFMNDFLVVIYPGLKRSGDVPIHGTYLILRYANIDPEKIEVIKKDEKIIEILKDWQLTKESLEINPTGAFLFIQATLKEDIEEDALECIFNFIQAISRYVKPVIKEKCEGPLCRMPVGQDLQLVLINGMPTMLCLDCIGKIDDVGKKTEEEYRKSPGNLLKGFVYGLSGMFFGALAWALVMIFLDRIGAVFAVLIFFLIVKAMDYAGTKRTTISLLLAGILALIGSILGTYIGIAGYLIKEKEIGINFADLLWVAKRIVEKPDILNEAIFFSLIGLIPYLFITWNTNRVGLKTIFKPEIEILQSFKLRS